MVKPLLEALEYLHAQGIVHRRGGGGGGAGRGGGGSFQNPEYAWFRKPGEARFALSLMIELFIGTQFSHLYTAVDTPAIAA